MKQNKEEKLKEEIKIEIFEDINWLDKETRVIFDDRIERGINKSYQAGKQEAIKHQEENLKQMKIQKDLWRKKYRKLKAEITSGKSAVKLVELGKETGIKQVEQLIDELKNPYPKDVFPEVTKKQLSQINNYLEQTQGFPLDRLSAHLMRIARENMKEEIKTILGGEV